MTEKMERTREDCLSLVRSEIRSKHTYAWTCLMVSVALLIISAIIITRYTFKQELASDTMHLITYGSMLVINTFSVGYISAFIFYYLHDYKPMTNDILEEYQRAYLFENLISQFAHRIETIIFEGNIPANNYAETFAKKVIERKCDKNIVIIRHEIWCVMRLNKTIHDDIIINLRGLRKDVVNINMFSLALSIDIYTQIAQKNWAMYNTDAPQVEYNDLLLVIENFKKSLDEFDNLIGDIDNYIYIKQDIEKEQQRLFHNAYQRQ